MITGGTSGLGRALALQLNELGAHVAVIARNQKKIAEVTKQNPKIIGIKRDISRKESIYPLAGEIHSRLGDVDILMNVAGYVGHTPLKLLVDTACEDFEQVLQTNLLAPFRLTKVLLSSMLLRQNGVIVNISSDAAVNPYAGWGAYSASKAALDQMSRIFDEELNTQGVRFLSIDPGDMNTPMHFAAIPDANPDHLNDPADVAQKILRIINENDFSQVRRKL